MEDVLINRRFRLTCPEGFRVLSQAEREKLNTIETGEGVCLANEEKHILVAIGWKEMGLLGALVSTGDVAKNMQTQIGCAMAPFGYRREELLVRRIGGRDASGFRYSYTAQGVDMLGESYVIREKRSLTYFHAYMRASLGDESRDQWNGLLDRIRSL